MKTSIQEAFFYAFIFTSLHLVYLIVKGVMQVGFILALWTFDTIMLNLPNFTTLLTLCSKVTNRAVKYIVKVTK